MELLKLLYLAIKWLALYLAIGIIYELIDMNNRIIAYLERYE